MHLTFSCNTLRKSVHKNDKVQYVHPNFNKKLHPWDISRNKNCTICKIKKPHKHCKPAQIILSQHRSNIKPTFGDQNNNCDIDRLVDSRNRHQRHQNVPSLNLVNPRTLRNVNALNHTQ